MPCFVIMHYEHLYITSKFSALINGKWELKIFWQGLGDWVFLTFFLRRATFGGVHLFAIFEICPPLNDPFVTENVSCEVTAATSGSNRPVTSFAILETVSETFLITKLETASETLSTILETASERFLETASESDSLVATSNTLGSSRLSPLKDSCTKPSNNSMVTHNCRFCFRCFPSASGQ